MSSVSSDVVSAWHTIEEISINLPNSRLNSRTMSTQNKQSLSEVSCKVCENLPHTLIIDLSEVASAEPNAWNWEQHFKRKTYDFRMSYQHFWIWVKPPSHFLFSFHPTNFDLSIALWLKRNLTGPTLNQHVLSLYYRKSLWQVRTVQHTHRQQPFGLYVFFFFFVFCFGVVVFFLFFFLRFFSTDKKKCLY